MESEMEVMRYALPYRCAVRGRRACVQRGVRRADNAARVRGGTFSRSFACVIFSPLEAAAPSALAASGLAVKSWWRDAASVPP